MNTNEEITPNEHNRGRLSHTEGITPRKPIRAGFYLFGMTDDGRLAVYMFQHG